MSVYSMTGYASAQSSTPQIVDGADPESDNSARLGIEIRSVNSRFLDLAFRLPDELRQSEPVLRDLLTGKLKRGKVEVRVWLESATATSLRQPSSATLQRLGTLEDSIKSWLPQAAGLSVADVLKIAINEDKKPHDHSDELVKLTRKALKDMMLSREREGARLGSCCTTAPHNCVRWLLRLCR